MRRRRIRCMAAHAPAGAASYERTFDLDLVNNTTTAPPGGDGRDPSGTHFINLASLLTSRDNLRQAAADLLALTRALPTLDLNGDAVADIDPNKIYFIGISLGGIVGTTYAGSCTATCGLRAVVASVPGGNIATTLLRDSASFGPVIRAGLAAQGLPVTALDQFYRDAQAAVDAGDPANYIAAATAARPYLLQQVIGGGTVLPDQVVPNSSTARANRCGQSHALRHARPEPRLARLHQHDSGQPRLAAEPGWRSGRDRGNADAGGDFCRNRRGRYPHHQRRSRSAVKAPASKHRRAASAALLFAGAILLALTPSHDRDQGTPGIFPPPAAETKQAEFLAVLRPRQRVPGPQDR